MSVDRTNIIRDPGQIVFGGATLYSGDAPIVVDLIEEQFRPGSDAFGPLNPRGGPRRVEIKAPLAGEWESLGVLFPYSETTIGTDIFGATDTPLKVHGRSGRSITVHNVAVTAMPTLTLGHDKTILGEVTFTGLIVKGGEPDDSAAYYTEATETYPGDAAFSAAAIRTLGYKASYAASGTFSEFFSEGGWSVNFGLGLEPKIADGHGTVGMSLTSVTAEASCVPLGATWAEFLALREFQGTGNYFGAAKTLTNLDISNLAGGDLVFVRLYSAALTANQGRYGAGVNMVGQATWAASRTVTSGTLDPIFYLGTAAPV